MSGFLLLFLWSVHCPHRYVHINLSPSPRPCGLRSNPNPRRLAMASTKIGLHLNFYVCVCVCACRPSCSGGLQHNWSENSPMMTTISVASMYVSIPSWLNFNVLLALPINPLALLPLFPMPKRFWQKEQQNKGPTSMTEVKYFPAIWLKFKCKLEMMICTCAKGEDSPLEEVIGLLFVCT